MTGFLNRSTDSTHFVFPGILIEGMGVQAQSNITGTHKTIDNDLRCMDVPPKDP